MEDLNYYKFNEFRFIKKYAIIKKTNSKCFFAYLIKINEDYIIGYRFCKSKWQLFKLNLDEIDLLKPYNPTCNSNCQVGITSLALLACF